MCKINNSHFKKYMMSMPMFKKAYKTCVKSTFSIYYVVLCALACCHASVFAAQGPSENDFGISSTLPWTQVITKIHQHSSRWPQVAPKSSQDSPKMTPGCPKMAPERTQVALKSSQDSFKVIVMQAFSLHRGRAKTIWAFRARGLGPK